VRSFDFVALKVSSLVNSLDTKEKNLLYAENDYNGFDILRWNLAVITAPRACHALPPSRAYQLQSTHCIYCRFDSRFHCSFVTVLITLANNDLFSIILKMSAEETPPAKGHDKGRQRTHSGIRGENIYFGQTSQNLQSFQAFHT
jgi:hypothetical protein